MLSYVLRKIQSDILGVGGATIFEVKSVTIITSLPYQVVILSKGRWNFIQIVLGHHHVTEISIDSRAPHGQPVEIFDGQTSGQSENDRLTRIGGQQRWTENIFNF